MSYLNEWNLYRCTVYAIRTNLIHCDPCVISISKMCCHFQGTNRTLLKWLKMWDYVVFGKERKETKTSAEELGKKKELQQNKFVNKRLPEVSEELDSFNRPFHKVRHVTRCNLTSLPGGCVESCFVTVIILVSHCVLSTR